jgi:anaphase-promoting complex subunit 2
MSPLPSHTSGTYLTGEHSISAGFLDRHFTTTVTTHFWQLLEQLVRKSVALATRKCSSNLTGIHIPLVLQVRNEEMDAAEVVVRVSEALDYLLSNAQAATELVSKLPESNATCAHLLFHIPGKSQNSSRSNIRIYLYLNRAALADKVPRYCRQVLLSRPKMTRYILSCFFKNQFEKHTKSLEPSEDGEEEADEDGPNFAGFCEKLREVHLIELCEEVFLHVLFGAIEGKIRDSCADIFEEPRLETVTDWLDRVVASWLDIIVGEPESAAAHSWRSRLEFFALETLATLRIGELFDIIVDYPQSQPALDDLKECLQRTKQYAEVVESLRSSFQKRLLHPGAQTSQILRIYIAAIKSIRQLDPSSVLLEHSCPELRAYLRQRSDTLRCIVSALTAAVTADGDDEDAALAEGGDPILIEELQNNDQEIQLANPDDNANDIAEDSEDEDGDADDPAFLKWTPMPTASGASALMEGGSENHRAADILSLLLGIYGTKDVFVKEYTSMLAEKLFAITDFNTDKQLRTVELLKLKFGESSLQNCEIMLKDMADSKRATTWVNDKLQQENKGFPLSTTIVSYLFWPEKFKSAPAVPSGGSVPSGPDAVSATAAVPKEVRDHMAAFSEEYMKFKASRRLEWQDHLGQVELTLEFGPREVKELTCTPQQASIIMLFHGGKSLTVEDMMREMAMPIAPGSEAAVRKRLAFWTNLGIIKQSTNSSSETFECIASLSEIKEEENGSDSHDGPHGRNADSAGGDGGQDDDNEDGLSAEPFIIGMLTNLGSMPLEKIHTMLSVLVPDYSFNVQQTAGVLKKMANAERIEQTGNEFSLKK